jgi:hypothetical protein
MSQHFNEGEFLYTDVESSSVPLDSQWSLLHIVQSRDQIWIALKTLPEFQCYTNKNNTYKFPQGTRKA